VRVRVRAQERRRYTRVARRVCVCSRHGGGGDSMGHEKVGDTLAHTPKCESTGVDPSYTLAFNK
jgi:hypothetical protein